MGARNIASGGFETKPAVVGVRKAASGLSILKAALRAVWWWLRQIFGDAAYENYTRHVLNHPDCGQRGHTLCEQREFSEKEFYLDRLRRKHNTVNRCC